MPIILQLTVCFLMALIITVYIIPIIVRVNHSLKLFDKPNERSSTNVPVPTLGGIAIFFSFVFVSTIGMIGYNMPELIFILAATLLIFFVGLKDDLVNLSPRKKLVVEIIAAVILIFPAQIRFTTLHGLFGISGIGIIPSVFLTAFVIIVIINAFNLTDGIDGLAASLSVMISLILGTWFFLSSHIDYAILSFALAGASGGFFYFNVYGKRNKIFMGDTGSLVLGTIISVLIIRFNEFNINPTQPYAIESVPAISFGILAYPLIDVIRVMTIRILNRKSPFSADKNHLHHRLLTLGLSHRKATLTILIANLLFILVLFTLHEIGILKLAIYIIMTGAILFLIPSLFIKKRNLIDKSDPVQQILIPGFNSDLIHKVTPNKIFVDEKPHRKESLHRIFFLLTSRFDSK